MSDKKKAGGLPDGWEKLQSVYVYAKPKVEAEKIKRLPMRNQGIWKESMMTTNPVELWVFNQGDEPKELIGSSNPHGAWGYKPGAKPDKCDVEDMWFFGPKSKIPKHFTPKGTWSFPVVKRDISGIAPEESGFLHIGTVVKNEPLDVAGNWRLLYQREGEDKGPGIKPPMKIHVKTPQGKVITLDVEPGDTIDKVKDKVKNMTGIPKDEQRLRHQNKPLDDHQTLEQCGVEHDDTLDLEPMEIYVKDTKGNKHTLMVDPTDKLSDVKKQVQKKTGIPKDQQRLTFRSKPVVDKKTVREHCIPHKGILQLEPMQIHVKTTKGKKITLAVEPTDTIASVKKKVENKEGISKKDQRLRFGDKQLDDDATLSNYNIKHDDTLELDPMQIIIKDSTGKKFPLQVDPNDTIDSVKDKIAKKGIPRDQQRLTFVGKPVSDKKTLRDQGVEHKSVLQLEPMQIHVKTSKGKKITLQVEPTDTIASVKKKVESKEGIPKKDQRMRFGDKQLDDGPTLDDYKVKHNDTLELDPMQIIIKDSKGKQFSLDVDPNDTIDSVKDKIAKKGIPEDQQRLTFAGKPVSGKKTLRDQGIEHKSILQLEPMKIHVKTPKGKKITLQVEPTDTIASVKKKVESKEGIPKKDQRLRFGDKPLDDGPTLDDYKVKHNDTLELDPMQIIIKDSKGKEFPLDVDPNDTIDSVKDKIAKKGIPKDQQRLTFGGKPVSDKTTLRDQGIEHKAVLQLEPMKIHVKTPKGKKLTFDVEPTDTIANIKKKVENKEGIPKKDQRMRFGDKELEDGSTLDDYNVKHDDTLELDPMHIIIKDWTGKKFPLQVDPTDTIDSIKDKIEEKEGHPKDIQYLIHGGTFLEDPKTLQNYKIKHKDVVNLDRMKIYVKDWKGKTFTLDVDPKDTIDDVKQKIQEREGLSPKDQILKFKGTLLQNPQTLDDCNIVYKDTVNLSKEAAQAPVTPKAVKPKVPQTEFTTQLSPYYDPFSGGGYSPKGKIKRDPNAIRAKTKDQYKNRWHTDLASEEKELEEVEKKKKAKGDK